MSPTCRGCEELPAPTPAFIPLGAPGEPLLLWAGPMHAPSSQEPRSTAPGCLMLRWGRRARLQWSADLDGLDYPFDPEWNVRVGDWDPRSLGIEFFGTPSELPVHVSGEGAGWSNGGYVGDVSAPVDHVVAHWVDLPALGGPLLHEHVGDLWWEWNGRAEFQVHGWTIVVDARHDHAGMYATAKAEESFVITHTMQIRRGDGLPFTAADVEPILEGLQFGLSFALGHWVCPAVPTGVGPGGAPVWAEWRPWNVDPPKSGSGWWNRGRVTPDLDHFLDVFIGSWLDGRKQASLRLLLASAISAVDTGYVEQRLLTSVAAIEMLSWLAAVRDGGMDEQAWRNRYAWQRIDDLLAIAKIDSVIRRDRSPALLTYARARSHRSGPRTVAEIRHRLTHPKDNSDLYAVEGLLGEASRLALHYLELLILYRLGYLGEVEDRTQVRGWAGASDAVPWAATSGDQLT